MFSLMPSACCVEFFLSAVFIYMFVSFVVSSLATIFPCFTLIVYICARCSLLSKLPIFFSNARSLVTFFLGHMHIYIIVSTSPETAREVTLNKVHRVTHGLSNTQREHVSRMMQSAAFQDTGGQKQANGDKDSLTCVADSSSSTPQRRSTERQHLESSRMKRPLLFSKKDDQNSVTKVKSCVLKIDTDTRKPTRKKSFINDKSTCIDPITEWTCRDSLTCVSDSSSSKSQRQSAEKQHLESSRMKRPLIFSKKDDQNSVTKDKSCSVLKMDTSIRKPVTKKGFTNDKPASKDPITGWTCQGNRSSIESRKQSKELDRKKSFSNDKPTCKDPITGWTCRENRSSIESRKQSIDSSSSKQQSRPNERQHVESSRTKRPLIFSKDDQNSVTKVKSGRVLKMDTGIRKPDRKKSFSNDKPTCKDLITEWTCRDSLTCVSDTSSKPQCRSTERQHPESSRTKRPLMFSKTDDQNSVTKVKSCSVLKMDTAIRKPVRKEGFTNNKPACKDPITEWTCRKNRSSIESRKQSKDDATGQKIVRHRLTDDDLFQELDKLEDAIRKIL